jgi:hypothetical protein
MAGTGLGFEGAGAAVSAVAAYGGYQTAQAESRASQNIAQLQQQAQVINYVGGQLSIRRNQLQEIRNEQQARSLALTTANAQGSSRGNSSALTGAYGNIFGEAGNTLLSLNQNRSLSEKMFSVNQSIGAQEQSLAKYQGQAAMWGGLGQIGGGLMSAGRDITSAQTNPGGAQQISS